MKWKIKKKWVNDFHSKTDTSLVSIALPLRRANFSKRENLKSVLLMGVSPPNRVPPLHPAGGPGGSQTPPLIGGLWPPVPATFSYSPAT